MAPRKSRQTVYGRTSRRQRSNKLKNQSVLPAASALSHKLSSHPSSAEKVSRSSPKRKKRRSQSSEEVLQELAQDALQEMREQGFLDQTGYSSQCDEMSLLYLSVEDKYDSLVANSSQVTVDECDEPQSPTTFFDRVGIKATAKPGFRKRNIHPPVLPPIMDDKRETKLQFSQCPSDCFSEDSASSVGTKTLDSFKNVTPATAEAAQYLLRLRG